MDSEVKEYIRSIPSTPMVYFVNRYTTIDYIINKLRPVDHILADKVAVWLNGYKDVCDYVRSRIAK